MLKTYFREAKVDSLVVLADFATFNLLLQRDGRINDSMKLQEEFIANVFLSLSREKTRDLERYKRNIREYRDYRDYLEKYYEWENDEQKLQIEDFCRQFFSIPDIASPDAKVLQHSRLKPTVKH